MPEGPQKDPKRPKTAFFGRKRIWWLPRQPFLTCETVSLHRPGCALTCFTYILHCSISSEPPDPIMAPKWPFWAIWGPFGVLLGSPNGTPDPRNGSNASLGMCPDLFHLYSTLFRQSGATTPPYGYKMTILGHLGPFWGPFGAPIAPLTRETVPLHCPGCALTCSTFTLHCSASSEPPDPLMAPKLPFLAVWGPSRVL